MIYLCCGGITVQLPTERRGEPKMRPALGAPQLLQALSGLFSLAIAVRLGEGAFAQRAGRAGRGS